MTDIEQRETQPIRDDGALVELVWLIKDQKRIGHGTMNELLVAMRKHFTGLDDVRCVVPCRDWPWRQNATPNIPTLAPTPRLFRPPSDIYEEMLRPCAYGVIIKLGDNEHTVTAAARTSEGTPFSFTGTRIVLTHSARDSDVLNWGLLMPHPENKPSLHLTWLGHDAAPIQARIIDCDADVGVLWTRTAMAMLPDQARGRPVASTITRPLTNQEAHEAAAGMNLAPEFFTRNSIDPDAPCVVQPADDNAPAEACEDSVPQEQAEDGSWRPATPVGLQCEHGRCHNHVTAADQYERVHKNLPNGWGDEPEFLCAEHGRGRTRITPTPGA